MSITITLNDELADKLVRQAERKKVPLAELAMRILENGLESAFGEETWSNLNSRRLALISKQLHRGLTNSEQAELAALQDAAARVSEPQDRTLLETLRAYERSAGQPTTQNDE